MNKSVSWPIVLLVLVLLGIGLYAYGRYVFNRPATVDTRADIPPRRPGDDKPATPPPGVQVPGTVPR